MKSIMKVGCGIVVLFIMATIGLLIYGRSAGESVTKEFFAHVKNDSSAEFHDRVHPSLIQKGDPEFIQIFMQTIEKECGAFTGLNMNGMDFSDKYENGQRVQKFVGTFSFERREVPMELHFIDGKLRAFSVNESQLAKRLLHELRAMPPSLETKYKEKAEEFWKAALGGEPEKAFELLHENMQRQYGSERFIAAFNGITQKAGRVDSIKFVSSRPSEEDEGQYLFFFVTDFPNKKGVKVHSIVEFAEFKGHLLGFSFSSNKSP